MEKRFKMFLNLTEMGDLGEIHVVLLSVENTYLEQRQTISALKILS
jgi:biotin synthase-like enzyme